MTASRFYSSTAGSMTLVGGISGAALTLTLDTAAGLPSVPFTLILDPGLSTEEAVTVTSLGGTTCTVTRGVDGTSAQSHANAAPVRHGHTARDFQDSRNHEDNTTTAHGVTGAVVGTTNTQTLTNKTMSGASNTFSAIPSSAVNNLDTHIAAANVHGVTVVAGTSDTQTLTNKTMSGASNTFTNIPIGALPADTVTDSNSHTLTNKTIDGDLNTIQDVSKDSIKNSEVWTSYVPTWTNLTVGNATVDFKYYRLGNVVTLRGRITWGSTTSASGIWFPSLPTAIENSALHSGPCWGFDNGTSTWYPGVFVPGFYFTYNFGRVSNTAPMTWATGDIMTVSLTYAVV